MAGRRFAAGVCAVFALVGVAILVVGGADGRALGAMVVLFFGVGGLALAAPLLSRGDGVELTEVGAERGFRFPISRLKQFVFALASLGMTAACVLIAAAGSWIIGGLGTVVFGGFTLALLAQMRGRHGLVMTPTRVVVDFNGRAELAWEDVAGVTLHDRYVGIRATEPGRVARTGRFNRGVGTADVVVPADALAGGPAQAVHLLEHYLAQPGARRAIGTADELARVI